jgi:hypothetical protein
MKMPVYKLRGAVPEMPIHAHRHLHDPMYGFLWLEEMCLKVINTSTYKMTSALLGGGCVSELGPSVQWCTIGAHRVHGTAWRHHPAFGGRARREAYNKGVVRGLGTGWERGAGEKKNGLRVGTRVPISPLFLTRSCIF